MLKFIFCMNVSSTWIRVAIAKHFTAEIEQGWFVYIHVCLCMCAYACACVYVHVCMLRRVPVSLCGELCSGVTSERLCSPWRC